MFDITGIGVCILTLTKTPQTSVAFVDCRGRGEAEERLQNGQFGGKSHINRTYKKIITTISNETITDIIAAIKQKKNIAGFCITTDIETIAKQNFSLEPSRYIEFDSSKPYHRKYCDIVKDINNIKKMQNSCKLTINKTLAVRIMGKDNVETYEKLTSGDVNFKKNIKTVTGCEIVKDDFINFTKAANEIKIECKNKEYLPPVFEDFVRTWITNNKNLGLFENIYLAELRDSLLPDLMDGTIDVSNMEIAEAKVK